MTANAKSGPPPDRPIKPAPPAPPAWRRYLLPIGIWITVLLLLVRGASGGAKTVDYSTLKVQVDQKKVQKISVTQDGAITGTYRDGSGFVSRYPIAFGDTDDGFKKEATDKGYVPGGLSSTGASSSLLSVILSFLPLLLFLGFFLYLGRAARNGVAGLGAIGRSKAKVIDAERPDTTFADVAGYEGVKQEISEVVDFLKNPGKYAKAGATGPKGVLMAGPPGTGKTLLARAVAGEANVPFIAVTGSSFVEMFVGVGASRVRDMFNEARKRAPSIIFIDEIDAIGQRRGGGLIGNDEREQTLNQMLAEMDGFDPSTGVVILGATNRPETLDPALLRPGRFDRQVAVPLPAQAERAAILAVHSRGKHLDPGVDLEVTARGTPGFSGADLASLINEAAIVAVRAGRDQITADDLSAARDRILLGQRQDSNVLLPEEKVSVAVHEGGHALVAALCEYADPVAKVTILPSGMALGVTEQLPEAERHLYGEPYLLDSLAVRLGGRAAELVVFGHGSTGASNDLAGATGLATRMVREFGLSPMLGPVGYSSGDPQYLGGEELRSRAYSEETQRVVDTEVSRLLREAEDRAVAMLIAHRGALDALTAALLEHETVDGELVHRLADESATAVSLAKPAPRRRRPVAAATAGAA